MPFVLDAVVLAVALIHLYILVLEMFLWERPLGLKSFGNSPERAADTRVLAANQGLYNGFLAAGLLWSLWLGPLGLGVKVFFLGCVLVAGLYGGATIGRKPVLFQALPASVGLVLTFMV